MQVAATKPSLTFFKPEDVRRLGVDVWTDDDEWDVRGWRSLVPPTLSPPLLLLIMLTILVLLFPPPLSSWRLQANYRIGDPILHIELRRWADIVLIAPCSANTLAKIASGVCDNLVVSPSPLRAQSPLVSSCLATPHHTTSLPSFPRCHFQT